MFSPSSRYSAEHASPPQIIISRSHSCRRVINPIVPQRGHDIERLAPQCVQRVAVAGCGPPQCAQRTSEIVSPLASMMVAMYHRSAAGDPSTVQVADARDMRAKFS